MEAPELIQRAMQGDRTAFDMLVAPYLTRAYRVASLITRNAETAADSVQEALIRAYQSLRNFKGGAFYPWFARIVVNEALRQSKRNRAWLLLLRRKLDSPYPDLGTQDDPVETVEQRESQLQLWSAIGKLSPAHRAVIVLRYYEDLSEHEMSAILNIPPGTVKSRLHHARTALERILHRNQTYLNRPAATFIPILRGGDRHD